MDLLQRKTKPTGTALLHLTLLLLVVPAGFTLEASAQALREVAPPASPAVALWAASGQTVAFQAENGAHADQTPPATQNLPYLVLYRNGSLTEPRERTLSIEVMGIEVPPAGVTVTLTVETQHATLDPSGAGGRRLVVWRASQAIGNTREATLPTGAVLFEHQFSATTMTAIGKTPTPTDYFRYEITIFDRRRPPDLPQQVLSMDYAFLMESQWIVPLPEVQKDAPGAAPDELILHYCDMFPFRRDASDPSTWLARGQVPKYIQRELIPAMVEAFRTQAEDWALPWHPAWTSYRSQDGRRLSVALSDGETAYHGPAPTRGHAGISINVNGKAAEYDSLTDSVLSVFHHELFHHYQRSLYQSYGGDGDVGGLDSGWEFFSEGTAVLASSVGQPNVQFSRTRWLRAYLANAKSFLGQEGFIGGDLNRSYERAAGYHAATYWRFLYERCGGMVDNQEDPAAGMAMIWQALQVLYGGQVVDVSASADLVEHLPAIMNHTLARSSCPFETYEQSLLAFSDAIYALRLKGGRCPVPGAEGPCGFYDPEGLYSAPPVSTITYNGEPTTYTAADQTFPPGIPSSFGIDLVEVVLDPMPDGYGLAIALSGSPGAEARFAVQVWKVSISGEGSKLQPEAEVIGQGPDRQILYMMPGIDATQYRRLGVAVTRLDAREHVDSEGSYTISLRPVDGGSFAVSKLPE